jgi:putative endonuclease
VKPKAAAPKRSVGGPNYPALSIPMNFHYVYILQSELNPIHFYTGLTEDLHARLKKHNGGEVAATATFRPWRVKTALAFTDHDRAADFERYLKSASGRAFARKRL